MPLRSRGGHTQIITFMDGTTLVQRELHEPPSYVADLYDAMLDAAQEKIERDNPPASVLRECDWLMAELENRARLMRALEAARQQSGSLPG